MPTETLGYQQLIKKVKLFEAIVNRTHDGILVFTHQLEVLFANRAAGELLRAKPGALRGKPLSDFIPEEMRAHHDKLVSLFNISSDTRLDLDEWRRLDCRRTDGTLAPVKISLEKIDIDGELAYVVAMKDMSECLKLEKEKSIAELRYFQAEQRQRWAGETLQLNLEGAITKIAKAAQLLKDNEKNAAVQEATASILGNAFAALSMGQKAAFFSDNSAASAKSKSRNDDPFKLVDKTVQGSFDRIRAMVDLKAQQKKLMIKWQIPAAAREFKLENCSQVEQIIFNIAEHAVSNSIGGEIRLAITDISYGHDDKINIEFECNMAHFGIPQQIMDLTLSASSNATVPQDSNLANNGMRLRLAKHLTDKIGGKMRVVTHPMEGTNIFVKLSEWELGRPKRLKSEKPAGSPGDAAKDANRQADPQTDSQTDPRKKPQTDPQADHEESAPIALQNGRPPLGPNPAASPHR